jgi:hypothetical protein
MVQTIAAMPMQTSWGSLNPSSTCALSDSTYHGCVVCRSHRLDALSLSGLPLATAPWYTRPSCICGRTLSLIRGDL